MTDEALHPNQGSDELFEAFFGISRGELRKRGIDPNEYAHKHYRRAVLYDGKGSLVGVAPSDILMGDQFRWAWRGYKCLFAGFGVLIVVALDPPQAVRILFLTLSVLALVAVGACFVTASRSYGGYLRACQSEGIEPKTRLNRPMPQWVKRLRRLG